MTGLNEGQLAKYGLVFGVLFVMFGIGASYVTCIIAVAYPAFMSFLALETEDDEDDKQWLTYWVVFGLFSIFDQFAGFILHWIPFYYFLKMGFLIWCFHPSTQGATIVYNHYIREASKPLTHALDEAGNAVKKASSQVTDKVSGVFKRN